MATLHPDKTVRRKKGKTFRLLAPLCVPPGFIFNEYGVEEIPIQDHPEFSHLDMSHRALVGIATYLGVGYWLDGVRVGPSAPLALPWSGGAR